MVNGEHLADTATLRATVCDAWARQGGKPPVGCAYDWYTWQEGVTLGAGIGAGVLGCAVLVACYCCCCKRRSGRESSQSLLEESQAQAARRSA